MCTILPDLVEKVHYARATIYLSMDETLAGITWEALEHTHAEKGSDWFWVLGIVTLAISVAAIVIGNTLFGVVVFLAGITVGIAATRPPHVIPYAVTTRGIRVDNIVYPYSTLETFFIDEQHESGPLLLVRSAKMFMPLFVIPLPEEYVDAVEALIAARLPEEHLEEPFHIKLFGFFGF
jgi:hypothetical protein